MKNLLACLAVFAAFSVSAQVNGFQLPYNPDSEPDGYIGVGDVLEVLAFFGAEMTYDGIYVDDDSTHVLLNVGSLSFPECAFSCEHTLPGSWRMATITDAGAAFTAVKGGQAWVNPKGFLSDKDNYGNIVRWHWDTNGTLIGANDFDITKACFCATHERPKVEYSYCSGTTATSLTSCIEDKLASGWYPLSGFPNHHDKQGYAAGAGAVNSGFYQYTHASFWRWAE